MSNCCASDARNNQERKLLWVVLILNFGMFVVEFIAGWLADSSGLLADSLDMLADAAVYSLSLYAVGRSIHHKARAALLNGSLQATLGALILVDIGRRIWLGSEPQPQLMFSIALLALTVNIISFAFLYQHRKGDVNLKASWICSRNDMFANVGVLISAGLVAWLDAPWPDWLVGSLIAAIVLHSSFGIIQEAKKTMRSVEEEEKSRVS